MHMPQPDDVPTTPDRTPADPPEPTPYLPGHRLVRKLGKGGFGEVWEATAPGGFRVALKLVPLHPQTGGVELRALQIIKDVRHPNLLTVFGAWQTDTLLVIGMELADRTLWDRFEEAVRQGHGGIPVRELLRYAHE